MPRPRTIAIGAFVVLLAATPFIPRGGGDKRELLPSSDQPYAAGAAETAGFGTLTPALEKEITRVVSSGSTLGRPSGKQLPTSMVSNLAKCADFEGQRYCLGVGWTDDTQAQVQARLSTAARTVAARTTPVESTGDLDAVSLLQRQARMSPVARAKKERRELTMAARSVAKVWLLRNQIQGVPLPDGFLDRHPEARAPAKAAPALATTGTTTTTALQKAKATPTTAPAAATTVKTRGEYPAKAAILNPAQVAEQTRTYWCGPTAMQMIGWGWKQRDLGQTFWADKLGTTTSGTAITDMVRVVNASTGWDRADHAGPYIVLDIGDFSRAQWELLLMRHIVDYKAPVVLHPILLKKFYPYLDDDASGHFQVGRGYDKNGRKPTKIGYFEPWNQQRFDFSEPAINRVQWRSAYRSYRGNLAHFQHNIGV